MKSKTEQPKDAYALSHVKTALENCLPSNLINVCFSKFAELKKDFIVGSYHSSAFGQFAEVLVDVLQHLATGAVPSKRPKVDDYLNNLHNCTTLPDSFRIEMARILRSLYTVRNKRTCHELGVDPNKMDAKYAVACAQWVLAELIRVKAGLSHDEAEGVIEWITAPLGGVIEDFGTFKTVLVKCKAEDEILLLMSTYSDWVKPAQIKADMKRTPGSTVQTALGRLHNERFIDKDAAGYYQLNQNGRTRAVSIFKAVQK